MLSQPKTNGSGTLLAYWVNNNLANNAREGAAFILGSL